MQFSKRAEIHCSLRTFSHQSGWRNAVRYGVEKCKLSCCQLFSFFSVCLCSGEAVAFVRPRAAAARQPGADPESRPGPAGGGALPPHLLWLAGCQQHQTPPDLGHQLPGRAASR